MSKLRDLCEIRGRVGWKGYTVEDLAEEGPLVLGANDITVDNRLDMSDVKHLTREKYEESPEIFIEKNDILVVKVGSTIGKVCIISRDLGEATINPNCVIVRATKINPYYLYYYLCSPAGRAYLLNNSSASGQPALNQKDLGEMDIPLIDDNKQKRISDFLNDINEKIETNNQINMELEELAMSIYQYWFLQCDFPNDDGKPYKTSGGALKWSEELKRNIPARSTVKKVNEIIDVKDGTHDSPKYVDDGKYLITSKHLTSNGIDFSTANHISDSDYDSINIRSKVDTGDILFSMIGAVGNVYRIDEEEIDFAIKNVALYKSSQYKSFIGYLYLTLKSKIMDAYISNTMAGSIQKFMSLGSLRDMPILYDEEIIERFNETTKNIFEKITQIKNENKELALLKNYTLPLLINGQITF